jgi:hypothetical protein
MSDERKVTIEIAWEDAKFFHEILDTILKRGVYPDVMQRLPTLKRIQAAILAAEPVRRVL